MGCQTNIACRDCKQNYYCGYGSYGSYDSRMLAFPIEDHRGHDLVSHFEDYTHIKGEHLICEGSTMDQDSILIENYTEYEQVEELPRICVRNLDLILQQIGWGKSRG